MGAESAIDRFRRWAESDPPFALHARVGVTIATEDVEAMLGLAKALEPFAAIDFFPDAPSSAEAIKVRVAIEGTAYETFLTIGDFRCARAALSKAKGEKE